jgi:hypothetical protein
MSSSEVLSPLVLLGPSGRIENFIDMSVELNTGSIVNFIDVFLDFQKLTLPHTYITL